MDRAHALLPASVAGFVAKPYPCGQEGTFMSFTRRKGVGMEEALFFVLLLAVGVGAGWYWLKYKLPKEKAAQQETERLKVEVARAENKVRVSDIIDRHDIEVLEQGESTYLNEAIALRREQESQRREIEGRRRSDARD